MVMAADGELEREAVHAEELPLAQDLVDGFLRAADHKVSLRTAPGLELGTALGGASRVLGRVSRP